MSTQATQPTPSLSFRFGAALGILAREFMRAAKQPSEASPWTTSDTPQEKPKQAKPLADGQGRIISEFKPQLSAAVLSDYDRTPAFVRKTGADLTIWFEENTKEVKPKKRRSPRKAKGQAATSTSDADSVTPKRSSLDQLIAPTDTENVPTRIEEID